MQAASRGPLSALVLFPARSGPRSPAGRPAERWSAPLNSRECRTRTQGGGQSHAKRAALFLLGPVAQRASLPRRSEEHTSELHTLMRISYAVFCLKKNNLHVSKYSYTTYYLPLTAAN